MDATGQHARSDFVTDYSALSVQILERLLNGDPNALDDATSQEGNLLRAIQMAQDESAWSAALPLAQVLCELYERTGRVEEWIELRGQLMASVGELVAGGGDPLLCSLKAFLFTEEAEEAIARGEGEQAETAYQKALDALLSIQDPRAEAKSAVIYYTLGWMAHGQQQIDRAEQLYRQALNVFQRDGFEIESAMTTFQLGLIAQDRDQPNYAETLYRQALPVFQQAGMQEDTARVYYQLGLIGLQRRQLDRPDEWFLKAAVIYEELGLVLEAADAFHYLGAIAQEQLRFQEAERWYHKALDAYERQGTSPALVNTLAAMGFLHWQQDHLEETVSWLGGALAIAADTAQPIASQLLEALAAILDVMGEDEFGKAWRRAFQDQEPPMNILRATLERETGECA
jgi:tetratricopeptide (TPR) repeat protein